MNLSRSAETAGTTSTPPLLKLCLPPSVYGMLPFPPPARAILGSRYLLELIHLSYSPADSLCRRSVYQEGEHDTTNPEDFEYKFIKKTAVKEQGNEKVLQGSCSGQRAEDTGQM